MKIGFVGLLTLLLVAAKLFGFATYSWIAAFSPVIALTGVCLLLFIVALILTVIGSE